jgi:hypothetical protein
MKRGLPITAWLAGHRFSQAVDQKYRFGARGSVAIGIAAESQMIHCLKKDSAVTLPWLAISELDF